MKKLVLAIVYTALLAGANPALAGDAEDIMGLRTGDMKKLIVHEVPKATSNVKFDLADGAGQGSLEDYRGKYVVLNFWATWCAPCRKEMPELNALQKELGGDKFQVVTIASGRNSPEGIKKFFAEAGVDSLPRHQDPKQQLSSQMGIFGLPITVIMNPEGQEIARMRGDANWHSESAVAIIKTLIGDEGDS